MSIKSKVLEEVLKKAQKIRDRRVIAANNKSLESAAFDFFRNIEESRQIHGGTKYDSDLFHQATRSLQERVRGFDTGTKVTVEFNVSEDLKNWEEQTVRGVTIWWSQAYIRKHGVDPSLYIDVSAMLFL